MNKLTIILVDDHQLFREGLKLLLQVNPKVSEIHQASNGAEFLKLLHNITPDVVLMDIAMPEMDGIEATRLALHDFPDLKVIALSMFGDEGYYIKMIEAGAKGFILKNSDIDVVETAIEI